VVPWEVAAAFPVPALTADQALTAAAPVPDGEWVLVHGAGGVTGGLAVQLAVARGASVVATAGPSSAARVRGWGAHLVVDYHDPEWPARVRDAAPGGRGVGAAVNAARGGAAAALQAVATDGRLATITGDPPRPERGWRSPTSTSEPTAHDLASWPRRLGRGGCRCTWGRGCRWWRRAGRCRVPWPPG
jgi:NADPH:quinone reductase-like Zn-dependent oxidoreductase